MHIESKFFLNKMRITEKITKEISPDGAINTVSWRTAELRKMLQPEKPIVKIPNRIWSELSFPFEIMEDVLNETDAQFVLTVFIPPYTANLEQVIANRIQNLIYDSSEVAKLHQKAAVSTLIRNISKKSPQIPLGDDMVAISSYEKDFLHAIRFTSWSILPVELMQTKVVWKEATDESDKLIEVESTLIFDQRKIQPNFDLKIDRRGRLSFDHRSWVMNFDLEKVLDSEIKPLEKIETPEKVEEIASSPESSTNVEDDQTLLPRPKKRICLRARFAISSDDED